MYVPNHFAMTRDDVVELLTGMGAADLVTAHDHGLAATFLPMVFDPHAGADGALLAHVTRTNRQWCDPVIGDALVIVHGAEHYISPRWLPSLAQTGLAVPTWNYVTAHAYGTLIAHDEPAWTLDVLRRLTARHEPAYSLDQVPSEFIDKLLPATVGVEIRLTRVVAKAKMSQNKMPAEVAGIIAGLSTEAHDTKAELTATWMQEHAVPHAEAREELLEQVARDHGPKRTA